MTIELLVRNRFVEIPGATAKKVAGNAWEVRIPRTPDVERSLRRALTVDAFDDATFSIDGAESVQATGSGESRDAVRVTVLL